MLRHRADVKTVLYMVIATGALVANWLSPSFNPALFALAVIMAVPVSVIAHNHNHLGVWTSRGMNRFQDYWLTLFYGFPPFAWIPTHNINHHKLNNREGDYTRTWMLTEKTNLFWLATYPFWGGGAQLGPVKDYLVEQLRKNPARGRFYLSQFMLLAVYLVAAFLLDWQKALLYIVIPQQVALNSVLIFNYVQHVHCDEESPTNHSRNFTGWLLNAYLLNNGYHTVHHDKPGLHWSDAPAAHAKIAHTVDPRLEERSFWWFILRVYVLSAFLPRFRSQSLRLERLASAGA